MLFDKNKSYPCFCVSNYDVIKSLLLFVKKNKLPLIIESTSSQVNQFGGYTNKTPKQFKHMINTLCKKVNYPLNQIIIGGDHLGQFPWRKMKINIANQNAAKLVKACVDAGYKKIHIDTSYKLLNDSKFGKKKVLNRSYELIKLLKKKNIFPIFGTEVPFPGSKVQKKLQITSIKDLDYEIGFYFKSLKKENLNETFACVVEPGMYFENQKIVKPKINFLKKLKNYNEGKNFFYEAHSCDYQNFKTLTSLVKNNFKFLKVGPELTYFYSRAILKMENLEKKLCSDFSKISDVILRNMKNDNSHWVEYYKGSETYKNDLLLNSKLDRVRYYWKTEDVIKSVNLLKKNINQINKNVLYNHFKINPSFIKKFSKLDNFQLIILFFLEKTFIKFYKSCEFKF